MVTTVPYSRGGEKPDGRLYPEDQPERVNKWNAMLHNAISQHSNVGMIDLNKSFVQTAFTRPRSTASRSAVMVFISPRKA